MTASRNVRNIFVMVLALAIFVMPIFAQAQENDPIFKLIPSNSLFCVRINNLTNSMNQLDQYLAGVSPIGVSMLVQSQLPMLLGSPQLAGLKMDGSFAAFGAVTASQGNEINIFPGILVPVSNYDEFINGIANKSPADDKGVVKIQSLENVLVTRVGDYALVTWETEYDNLMAYKNLMGIDTSASAQEAYLSSTLDSAEMKLATTEPLWVYGNIQQAAKSFGPMLSAVMEGMTANFANIPSTTPGVSSEDIQSIMKMYVTMIDTVMKEAKSVSLSINPSANCLNITNTVSAVPGTTIAKMFTSGTSAKANSLLPYLEDGAAMNLAFSFDSPIWSESIDMQMNLMSMLSGEFINKEEIEKLKSLSKEMIDCMNGPVAYSIKENSKSSLHLSGKYFIAVKDEKKFKELLTKSAEMMMSSGFFGLYQNMGIDMGFKINQNVETYKGVSIDSATLTMKTEEGSVPAEQAQMIEALYGDGVEYRWGVTNGLFAAVIGNDSSETIHKLIDQIQSGQAKEIGSETKAAIALIPGSEKADFLFTMNLLRVFKMGAGMMSSALPIPVPEINAQTKSNIVMAGTTDNGKMTLQIAIPKEHLQEIMGAIMSIQQEMMTAAPSPAFEL